MPKNKKIKPATRIRGLLVGINSFPKLDPAHQLHGCVHDVQNMGNVLMGKFVARPDDIRQLHDGRATKKAVMERLKWLVAHTGKNEIAVFHISTHGSLITRRHPSGQLMDHASEILCLSNISPQLDDPESYITDSELAVVLSGLHPQALFIAIMDACHSGATQIARDVAKSGKSRYLEPPEDIKHRDKGRIALHGNIDARHRLFARSAAALNAHVLVLTACGPNQSSNDSQFGTGKTAHFEGAFTHFLCEVLQKSAELSYQELLNRVHADLNKDGDTQTPEFMPDAFSKEPVFEPLREDILKQRRRQGFGGNYRFSDGKGKIVKAGELIRGIDPITETDNPDLQKILSELATAGFAVQAGVDQSQLKINEDGIAYCDVALPAGNTGLLLEYHDGLAIWHKVADAIEGRNIANDATWNDDNVATGTRSLTFSIPPVPQRTVSRHIEKDLGDEIGSLFHLILHPIETVTKFAVQEIEEGVFDEGLYHYTGNDLTDKARKSNPNTPITPPIAEQPQAVLFIHGVLSSVEGCFNKNEMYGLLSDLQKKYIVLGYDHLSASVSIEEIAQKLDQRLRACLADNVKLTIITHSQGGVIARELVKLRNDNSIDRIFSFGSPHQGTNLANNLDKFVTVLAALPIPYVSFVFKLLKYVDSPDVIPGFLDMEVGGECINSINNDKPCRVTFYCGTSVFTPDPADNLLIRLAEQMESWALFANGGNDLVIDTVNMVPPDGFNTVKILELDSDQHVMHTQYFDKGGAAVSIQQNI